MDTKKPSYVYIRFNSQTGEYENHRKVTKGRKPLNYVKFAVDSKGNLNLVSGEYLPSNARLDTVPKDVSTEFRVISIEPEVVRIKAEQPLPPTELAAFIKSGTSSRSGRRWVFHMCDIIGAPSIEYLAKNREHSRIDLNLDSGEVHIWSVEYAAGYPDLIIENAIATESVLAKR